MSMNPLLWTEATRKAIESMSDEAKEAFEVIKQIDPNAVTEHDYCDRIGPAMKGISPCRGMRDSWVITAGRFRMPPLPNDDRDAKWKAVVPILDGMAVLKSYPKNPTPNAQKAAEPTPSPKPTTVKAKVKDRLETPATGGRQAEAKAQSGPAPAPAGSIWGPPIPLASRTAEPMPDGIFTGWLGDYVEAVAAFTETPRELASAFALAVIATTVQRRFNVQIEPGYFEPLAFWVVAAMASGNRKSAVLKELCRPLIDIEGQMMAAAADGAAQAESEAKTIEARASALRGRAAKAEGKEFDELKVEIAELEKTIPAVPKPARLFAQDITTEKLGAWLAESGERGSILSDEGGLFDLLAGRYSNGIPNLDLYLQSHCASFVRVDRFGRPSVILNHPCLTIALSPQPAVLSSIIARPDFRGRGLLARFVYLFPQSKLGYRQLKPAPIPDHVRRHYGDSVKSLAGIEPRMEGERELPRCLQLDAEAYRLWKAFQAEVETMMRPDGRLEHLTDWASKLPGACARVAALLHAADFASCLADNLRIGEDVMDRAIVFCRTAIDHALLAFDQMNADPGHEGARKVWRTIEQLRKRTFTMRDIWHPMRGAFPTVAAIEPSIEILVASNHILERANADYQKRGRPSRAFIVNPELAEGWTRE